MKPFRSLRLRITLLCALLLTLCCAALAVTSNLSAIHLTDTIAAAPLSPALDPEAAAKGTMPLLTTQAAPVVQQAQQLFQIQSILASTVILAAGLLLIYLLVGRALAPLKDLNDQIQGRTAKDLDQPLSIPDRGDEVTQLAHSFDDLSQRLSRAFLMQRSFSQNAAHEFRTPLAVLKTRIGLFRKKQDFAPQTTEAFLSIMESEVDRLSGMVNRGPAATGSNWENCSTKLPRMFPLWPPKRASPFWWKPPLARSPAAESCSAGHCSIWWKMRSNTGRMADRHGSVRS